MQNQQPKLKYFKITSYGEDTFEWAPSKQSIMEDLQRAGALDDTTVEEVDPNNPTEGVNAPRNNQSQPVQQEIPNPENVEERIFTLPGGQKVKNINGIMYALEWITVSREDLIERINCEDIDVEEEEFPTNIRILDWVELKPEGEEGEEDAS